MKILIIFMLSFASYGSGFAQNLSKTENKLFHAEVLFDFGKHEIRPEADTVLASIGNLYEKDPNLLIFITAHTDSIGSVLNNQKLSMRRAESIMNHLMNQGIPPDRIEHAVYGESQPLADNFSEAGRQMNRRATIDVFGATPLLKLEGNVRDAQTGKGLVAQVIVRTKFSRDSILTDTSGYFCQFLKEEAVVGIDVTAPCYFFKTEMTKAVANLPPLRIDLSPANAGELIALDNLYFLGGLPVLLEKSRPELPKILKFMLANPAMKIEIAGHVNVPNTPPLEESDASFQLSVRRAKVVYDYLLDNGIDSQRISFKGYGNSQMIFPNAVSEREMAKNRRVELRVLENECF